MKKTLLLIAVLTTAILPAQNLPSYVPTDGLEAYYSFELGADDLSGNSHHCTIDGAVPAQNILNIDSSAFLFDGVNDRLNIGTEFFNGSVMDTVTLRVLFKLNSLPNANNEYTLWNKDGSWKETRISVNSSGAIFIRWAYNSPNGYHQLQTTNNQVSPNSWVDLIIRIYNNTGDMVINNSLITQYSLNTIGAPINFSHSGSCGTAYGNHRIGANKTSCNMTGFFDGIIDEFGIWPTYLDSTKLHLLSNICSDSIIGHPTSSTFQTSPGTAYFLTSHSDTSATYQWQQNTGTSWTNLSDFGIYSGTTTDSLVMTGITTALNGYVYRCVIDACTMDTTDVAFLTVVDNVGIDEDEATITIAPNPTSGILTIGLNSAAEYKVYNVNGRVVAKGNTDGLIDLTNLPSGSYQLILDSEDVSTVHSIQKI